MQPNLLSVEILVESADRAIQLLVETLGFALVERHRSLDPAGEMAIVDVGGIMLTILQPALDGPGPLLPVTTPRVTQLVVGTAPADIGALRDRVEQVGLATQVAGDSFFLVPEAVGGALGIEAAIVVVPFAGDE